MTKDVQSNELESRRIKQTQKRVRTVKLRAPMVPYKGIFIGSDVPRDLYPLETCPPASSANALTSGFVAQRAL